MSDGIIIWYLGSIFCTGVAAGIYIPIREMIGSWEV